MKIKIQNGRLIDNANQLDMAGDIYIANGHIIAINESPANIEVDHVIDATGKVILQQEGNTTQINVEKLMTGLYILEVYSGNQKFTSKFIKE